MWSFTKVDEQYQIKRSNHAAHSFVVLNEIEATVLVEKLNSLETRCEELNTQLADSNHELVLTQTILGNMVNIYNQFTHHITNILNGAGLKDEEKAFLDKKFAERMQKHAPEGIQKAQTEVPPTNDTPAAASNS